MKIIKREGQIEEFDFSKLIVSINRACNEVGHDSLSPAEINSLHDYVVSMASDYDGDEMILSTENLREPLHKWLKKYDKEVAKSFIKFKTKRDSVREFVKSKEEFIRKYKEASNNANATVDDNSNVGTKNIGTLNNEIHKSDNIEVSRGMIMRKLQELYPDFDEKNYIRDLEHHIIYKHDESSFCAAIAPYCVSVTLYPFLLEGLKSLGGLSAKPKTLDSYCGIISNLIFAISSQFAGAVAVSEFLLYFDYFARKEWGDDYYLHLDDMHTKSRTIHQQIHQHFQSVIYSINQPVASRGLQSAFVNFSYFDKPFFEGMFGEFMFPDGTKPIWDSLKWIQKDFMMWFNEERTKTMITFPKLFMGN